MVNQYLPCVLAAYSDSSFTNPHQVVLETDPPSYEGRFTHMGAEYWGVETDRHIAFSVDEQQARFRFDPDAHHTLDLELTRPSLVREVRVSTRWHTGSHVPNISVELRLPGGASKVVLDRAALAPDQEHVFELDEVLAHGALVRCYHEGGIARINLFGEPAGPPDSRPNVLADARILRVSNDHFGCPEKAVAGVREEDHMIGWESARMGFGEHVVFELVAPVRVDELVVDTYLYRLNAPLSCHLFGLPATVKTDGDYCSSQMPCWTVCRDDGTAVEIDDLPAYMTERCYLDEHGVASGPLDIQLITREASPWVSLIEFGRLYPDRLHRFQAVAPHEAVSHLLYMHFPNGGIHGLRVHAQPENR